MIKPNQAHNLYDMRYNFGLPQILLKAIFTEKYLTSPQLLYKSLLCRYPNRARENICTLEASATVVIKEKMDFGI